MVGEKGLLGVGGIPEIEGIVHGLFYIMKVDNGWVEIHYIGQHLIKSQSYFLPFGLTHSLLLHYHLVKLLSINRLF